MVKQIYQFRYYDDGNSLNYPNGCNANVWYTKNADTGSADVFSSNLPEKAAIIQLGIQTIPGTKFYINGALTPITVGVTGIYELSLEDKITISTLKFNQTSIERIRDNDGAYLIVDMLVREEESY